MFLPKSSSAHRRYLFGRYVARRVARAGFSDLLVQVNAVNAALLSTWRQCQDALVPVEEATADRDVVDEGLDLTVRLVRKDLGSRSIRAEREAPYTLVFPNGIEEYVSARLGQQVAAYQLLCSRMVAHLGATDPVCVSAIPDVQRRLVSWTEAVAMTDMANQARDIARTRLAVAVAEWEKAITAVYGLLLARVGKDEARRFFPKETARKRKTDEDEELVDLDVPPVAHEVDPLPPGVAPAS